MLPALHSHVTHICPSQSLGSWAPFPARVVQVNDGSVNLEILTPDGRTIPAYGQTEVTAQSQYGFMQRSAGWPASLLL